MNIYIMQRRFTETMKIFRSRIDLSSKPPVLGRWKLHNDNIAHMKADMTNEDHCGVCYHMRYNYLNNKKPKIETKNRD